MLRGEAAKAGQFARRYDGASLPLRRSLLPAFRLAREAGAAPAAPATPGPLVQDSPGRAVRTAASRAATQLQSATVTLLVCVCVCVRVFGGGGGDPVGRAQESEEKRRISAAAAEARSRRMTGLSTASAASGV